MSLRKRTAEERRRQIFWTFCRPLLSAVLLRKLTSDYYGYGLIPWVPEAFHARFLVSASPLVSSAFDRRNEAPRRTRENTSGTQGNGLIEALRPLRMTIATNSEYVVLTKLESYKQHSWSFLFSAEIRVDYKC